MNADPANVSETDAPRFAAWVTDILATVRARLWWVVAVAAAALLVAILYLRTAEYTYSASFRVVPAPGSSREAGNLGALTTLATLTGATLADIPVTAFRLYLEAINTRQLAAQLSRDPALMQHVFADEWDARAGQWREPGGIGQSLGSTANRIAGQPVDKWSPPDAARLQQWITSNVRIDQTPKTPVVTLSVDDRDPVFARTLLTRLHQNADAWVRARALGRTRANVTYLESRLPNVTQADHREAIFATLNDQQQRSMTASNPAPFAAEPFGAATVSAQPTTPRQLPVIIIAVLFGAVAGVAAAVLVPRRA
jgi:uncharacterized protein involved in exopolysaccharide biosynthesis